MFDFDANRFLRSNYFEVFCIGRFSKNRANVLIADDQRLMFSVVLTEIITPWYGKCSVNANILWVRSAKVAQQVIKGNSVTVREARNEGNFDDARQRMLCATP